MRPPNSQNMTEATETKSAVPEDLDERVTTAIKSVYDPEIPVDIYELGLIYDVTYSDAETGGKKALVTMTLTAPGCPVAGDMPGWVETAVGYVDGIDEVEVKLTFDPPWTPDLMSEAARLELGMF